MADTGEGGSSAAPSRQTPPGSSHDTFLAILVRALTSAGARFGLTLLVDGATITGTVITPEEYFELLGQQLNEAWSRNADDPGDFRSALRQMVERGSTSEDSPRRHRQSIHLKDAVILGPGDQLSRVGLWRGSLDHVGGWSLGQLDTT